MNELSMTGTPTHVIKSGEKINRKVRHTIHGEANEKDSTSESCLLVGIGCLHPSLVPRGTYVATVLATESVFFCFH